MKLSKKAEYALRALVAMGRESPGRTFSIHEIADSQRIPLKFLEQILLSLKNGGLLRSKRGVGGGYQLQATAKEISLRQVIDLIDGSFQPIPCCDVPASSPCECGVTGGCGLGLTLRELQDLVHQWLDRTTIATIIEHERPPPVLSFDI